MRFLTFVLMLMPFLSAEGFYEEPWGKDCDLASKKEKITLPGPSPLSLIGQKLVRFHQTVISPIDGPRSHYYPCSSQYTLSSMRRYGFIRGFLMGCDRLMRENTDPWVYPEIEKDEGWIKYDPVPVF